jgi:hypothetical protein
VKRIHLLLGKQSLIGILVSFNRLGSGTLGYVRPNQFLRWVDLNCLLAGIGRKLDCSVSQAIKQNRRSFQRSDECKIS